MANNPPFEVQNYGQSIWLDYIHRQELENGEFQRRIDEDGVMGVTSNPSIFQQAIGESDIYDESIRHLLDLDPVDIYEKLAIADIQVATEIFRPIYDRTGGRDGYVSLEVSPDLANDTERTIEEAKRLFATVDRPNLMVKIPGTQAGVPAIEEAIAAGINVNVTLLFSVENYIDIAEAYIRGLERRLEAGEDISNIASVASFFLSRIDSMVDRVLENNMRVAQVHGDTTRMAANRRLLGQAAIANAKLAYQAFKRLFYGDRFEKLREAGAMVQRPLWASTGTKNPRYSDTRYIDTLIGPDTVNTVPPKTLAAFKDHGTAAETINRDLEDYLVPEEVMDQLAELGIEMAQITNRLQVDGVDAFQESFDKLINQIAAKRTVLHTGIMARQNRALGVYIDQVSKAVSHFDDVFGGQRVWSKDGSLWKNHGPTIDKIKNRLGWLDIMETIDRQRLVELQQSVYGSDFEHVVLLGMGGSSLAPEVMFRTFGRQAGYPELLVLDDTDPIRVKQIEDAVDLKRTLFIVASKSGTTVETHSFYEYFYQQTGGASDQFIAITDEGSKLAQIAQEQNFRDLFINPSDIGGRYSALSYFGLVPGAMMGLDLDRVWYSAGQMFEACGEEIPGPFHPGVTLGATIAALARESRDKLCIFTTQSVSSFGDWAEQLIAESLGKEGKGVLPVVGQTAGKPHDYATDRVFVYIRVDGDSDADAMDASIRALRQAGHPRVTLRIPDTYALFGEFFRWEYATAVAGQMLGVNPFDEPNVTEAKEATKAILEHFRQHGSLPESEPFMSGERVRLYADDTTLNPLREMCRAHGYDPNSRTEVLAAQIAGSHAGDYFAILSYLTPDEGTDEALRDVARRLRHVTRRAVTLGYGPRYLHSTGQLHKGGSDNGIFLVLTRDLESDVEIPGESYSFGTLFQAQALGDMQALQAHNRRVIRMHISGNVQDGIDKLLAAVDFVEERRLR